MKRSIKVPAVSSKLADIPPDEYSWRKYGQKPIKGSPHPRYVLFCFTRCLVVWLAAGVDDCEMHIFSSFCCQ